LMYSNPSYLQCRPTSTAAREWEREKKVRLLPNVTAYDEVWGKAQVYTLSSAVH
jgi:hypothetical protein